MCVSHAVFEVTNKDNAVIHTTQATHLFTVPKHLYQLLEEYLTNTDRFCFTKSAILDDATVRLNTALTQFLL